MELHDGDIIVFNDILTPLNNQINLNFIANNGIIRHNIYMYSRVNAGNNYITLVFNNGGPSTAYEYTNGRGEVVNTWTSSAFKTITVYGDQTINDENSINWLYENTVSGLPPRIMENMYAVVGDQIQYSFSNIGDVVGSIVNNGVLTIFTLGIFIISLAVGLLRRITRRKNFK